MRNILFSAVALAALTGYAMAGDLASTKEAPIFSWTGLYVGANLGTGAGVERLDFGGGQYKSYDSDGTLGGFQVGGNYQINRFVLGLEADYDFAGIQGAHIYSCGAISCIYGGAVNSLGSGRGRLGYAFLDNRALAYVTGGLAYGQVKGLDRNPKDYGQSFDATGWAVGGGLEYAITDHWTVRGEYLYAELGPETWTKDLGTILHSTVNVFRVGVNYKFGAPEAPVVAKY